MGGDRGAAPDVAGCMCVCVCVCVLVGLELGNRHKDDAMLVKSSPASSSLIERSSDRVALNMKQGVSPLSTHIGGKI